MDSDGMKCVACVLSSLNGKDISTDSPVQEGVNDARAAVVVYKSDSLCVAHLHERIQDLSMAEYAKAILATKGGR